MVTVAMEAVVNGDVMLRRSQLMNKHDVSHQQQQQQAQCHDKHNHQQATGTDKQTRPYISSLIIRTLFKDGYYTTVPVYRSVFILSHVISFILLLVASL